MNLGGAVERSSAVQATEMMDRGSRKLQDAKRVALETEEVDDLETPFCVKHNIYINLSISYCIMF